MISSLMIYKYTFENLGPFSEDIKHIELLMTKFYKIYRQRHLLFYQFLPNFYEELQSCRVKLNLENNLLLLLVFLVVLWSYHIAFLIDNAAIKEDASILEFLSFTILSSSNSLILSLSSLIIWSLSLTSSLTSSWWKPNLYLISFLVLRILIFLTSRWNLPFCPIWEALTKNYSIAPSSLQTYAEILATPSLLGFFYE